MKTEEDIRPLRFKIKEKRLDCNYRVNRILSYSDFRKS